MSTDLERRKIWRKLKEPWHKQKEIKNNRDLIEEINRTNGVTITKPVVEMMLRIAEKQIVQIHHQHSIHKEDLVQEAVRMMVTSYPNFNLNKSNYPRGYLMEVCNSAFLRYLRNEKKQDQIKEALNDIH